MKWPKVESPALSGLGASSTEFKSNSSLRLDRRSDGSLGIYSERRVMFWSEYAGAMEV